MFGRHKKKTAGSQATVAVEATLEGDIDRVEQMVAAYLARPTDGSRRSLFESLQALDAQTEQSDAYGSSAIGSGAVGYASRGEVLGETSPDPVVDEVPSAELGAQFALVKAAKDEMRQSTATTRVALQEAYAAVIESRDRGSA